MIRSNSGSCLSSLAKGKLECYANDDRMRATSDNRTKCVFRYVPLVRNLKIRTTIGFILLFLSATLAGKILGKGRLEVIVLITAIAWLPAILFTDKYVHKYPQRYVTYLLATHLKAATIMAFFLWLMGVAVGPDAAPHDALWSAFISFVFADALVSLLRRRDFPNNQSPVAGASPSLEKTIDERSRETGYTDPQLSSINTRAIINLIRSNSDKTPVEFIKNNLPDHQEGIGDVLILDDLTSSDDPSQPLPVGLLIGRTHLNHVRRLNRFLLFCSNRIAMGGYLVVRYTPLENVTAKLKERYRGLLYWPAFIVHFVWYQAIPKIPWLDSLYFSSAFSWLDALYLSFMKRRNRVLSKAEVWGRLAFHGMDVIAESNGEGERYIMARRVASAVQNRRPSYYLVVALEKVGLDGQIIRTHKIRTMFPFSEFLQKRVFEDHGLTSTGKFSNDFRLTEFGRVLRKYWLDELPQIFDWLHGEVKLVGIRATSRHFLSLYPEIFLDLYIQTKPGLIPPIFDDSISGFDQIVEVELAYLQRYRDQPFRTDVRYLIRTFVDIVFKGIRSH